MCCFYFVSLGISSSGYWKEAPRRFSPSPGSSPVCGFVSFVWVTVGQRLYGFPSQSRARLTFRHPPIFKPCPKGRKLWLPQPRQPLSCTPKSLYQTMVCCAVYTSVWKFSPPTFSLFSLDSHFYLCTPAPISWDRCFLEHNMIESQLWYYVFVLGPHKRKHPEVNFDIHSLWLKTGSCRQTCPTFAPDKDVIFIIWIKKQTCPVPWRKTLHVFKGCPLTNILKKIVWNKVDTRSAEMQLRIVSQDWP